MGGDRLQKPGKLLGRQGSGGAAPNVDGADLLIRGLKQLAGDFHFLQKRLQIGLDQVCPLADGAADEAAVGTAGGAEGNAHIQGKVVGFQKICGVDRGDGAVHSQLPAVIGDVVNITYTGTIDGQTYSGSKTDEAGDTIILGYADYVDDFEEKIVGMSIGETRTIEITYPSYYGNNAISGKTAQFEIKLNKIQTYALPELTDEFVVETKINEEVKTVAELEKFLKEQLRSQRKAEAEEKANLEHRNLTYEEKIEIIKQALTAKSKRFQFT